MGNLFQELKRRNVYRVATGYAVISWLLIQVADTLFPIFELPDNAMRLLAVSLLIGFVLVLPIAWLFELTPEGIKKTLSAQPDEFSKTGPVDYLLGGMSLLIIGFIAVPLVLPADSEEAIRSTFDDTALLADETAGIVEEEVTGPSEFSIAVLPLANLSPDPNNAYFAAGIHEEILNQLVKAEQLQVTSRTSVQRFEDSELSIQEIARELNVSTIMEGSVRFAGNQVRITTQLIRASDDVHLWSETYQREYDDIFAIQSDVAIQVANAMNATITASELANIERPPTNSTVAYSLYLQAVAGTNSSIELVLQEERGNTISLLERAIALDPAFAQAYSFLAFQKYAVGLAVLNQRPALWDEALLYANKAIEIDPNLAQPYMVLSRVYFDKRQWGQWLFNARKSVELPSLDGQSAFQLSSLLVRLGHYEAVQHWMNIAISKSSTDYDLLFLSLAGALYSLNGGDYESSLALSDQYLDLGGSLEDDYHTIRAVAYHFLERDADSLIELNQIQQTPFTVELWGYPEYLRCQTAAREQILQEIGIPTENDGEGILGLAFCALGASDLDTFFGILETAMQQNQELSFLQLSFLPLFNEVRQDPRWQAVEEYLDLPVLTDIQIPY